MIVFWRRTALISGRHPLVFWNFMRNDQTEPQLRVALSLHNGHKNPLTDQQIDAIRQFDTCTIANAIEEFVVRLRNEGYTLPGLRCFTSNGPKLLGFAAPCRIKLSDPPLTGRSFLDRTDWWAAIEGVAVPRIAVIQDIDPLPSSGACIGEVHAAILKAFHCDGVITNGAVRDLLAVAEMGFEMFAQNVAVSHAYMHMVDYGTDVEILGLKIRCGDLLFADCHGVLSIPLEIAAELPLVAARIRARDRRIVDVCNSPDFSTAKLKNAIQEGQE
jgi:4-hydroxy-4-methyl-2-oxoglutarate aldolase